MRRWLGGVLLTAFALTLLGGFLYFVFARPRATPLICLHVTDYEAPLMPQSFAQEDVQRFTQLFYSRGLSWGQISTGSIKPDEIKPLNVSTGDEFLEALLKRVREEKPGGPNKDVILIYLSAQGLVDAEGKPCLLAAAAPQVEKELDQAPSPGEILSPQRLVRLETLLARLKQEHPWAWKVVLLDTVRWERNWRLGIAENRFADALQPLMATLTPTDRSDKVVLINSCSPGEIGLADPVQERTIFGDYVARGLAGQADTKRDGRIQLSELSEYLAKNVQATAQRRGREQRPQLILPGSQPDKIDFVLARSQQREVDGRATSGAIAQRVTSFAARWERLPDTGNQGRIPAPLVVPVEKTRQEMLRHEALLLGGKAYKDVTETEPAIPLSWPEQVYEPAPAVSLPLSLPAAHGPVGAIEASARSWAAKFAAVPADQADPAEKLARHEKLFGLWSALREPSQATSAEQLFPRAGLKRAGAIPVELHTWIRFNDKNPLLPKAFQSADAIDDFLQCREAAERAAYAAGDPRAYRWIAPAVEAGDVSRREAEDLAFANAERKTVLERLAEAQKSYQQAAEMAVVVADAFALRDQALANMPYWLEWTSVGDSQRMELGLSFIDRARELELLLDDAGEPGDAEPKLTGTASNLKEVLAKLQESVTVMTTKCLGDSFHLGYLAEMEQLLAGPLVDRADRPRLWEKYFKVLEGDVADANQPSTSSSGSTPGRFASGLLKRWLAKQGQDSVAKFDAVVRSAREELAKEEKDFAATDQVLRTRLAQTDRTIRGMTAWLTLVQVKQLALDNRSASPAGNEKQRKGANGAVLREECAQHDYYHWQARRFLDDFLGNDDGRYRRLVTLVEGDTLEPYFFQAASQLLDGADQLFPREKKSPVRELLAARRSAAAALLKHIDQTLRPASDSPTSPDESEVTVQTHRADPAVQQIPTGQAALHLPGAGLDRDGSGVAVALAPRADASAATSEYFAFAVPGPLASGSPPCVLPGHFRFLLPAVRQTTPWKTECYFRGHAGTIEFAMDPLQAGHVILASRSQQRGKLTVNSSLTDGSVVVVLDCSASMNDVDRKWMGDAVEAVRTIIGRLLETRKMEVSLVLFAHRRGVPKSLPRGRVTELPWNPVFGGDKDTVMFEDDIQTVWKGTTVDERLKWVLGKEPNNEDRIQAAGYTPLYSAVRHAALDGFTASRKGSRNLVIVSDGGDFIPLPTSAGMPIEVETHPDWIRNPNYNSREVKQKRAAEAREAIERLGNVEVSLVYLASLNELPGGKNPVEESQNLLRISDDRVFKVEKKKDVAPGRNVETLVRHLAASMGIYPYEVVEDSGERHAGSTAERLEYTVHGRSTVEWDNKVQAAFEIDADESLQAEIRRDGNQRRVYFLGGEDFDRDAVTQTVLLAKQEAKELAGQDLYPPEYRVACRAEQPKVGDKHRTFHVAIHSSVPGQFSPRPREVWVDVVPSRLAADGKPPMPLAGEEPYFFCEPAFVADSPVPVVELQAPDWPRVADAALVRIWFRMTDSREVTKLDEAGLKRAPGSQSAQGKFTLDLEFLPDRKQWAIKVIESQPRVGGEQPAWSYVSLEGTPADDVERRYYPANGRVEHYFLFRDQQKADLSQRAVDIVPQAVWKQSAATISKEFAVTIPRN